MVNKSARAAAMQQYIGYSALRRMMAVSKLAQDADFAGAKRDPETIREELDQIAAQLNDLQTLFEFLDEGAQGRLRDIPGFGCPAFWACQLRDD